MKLKLTQPGYESMTGLFGITFFENGVSVTDVPLREARQIAMSIKAEYEDGSDPNPAQNLLNSMHNKAGEVTPPLGGSETQVPTRLIHTQESLGKVADEQGIKGLRVIASQFDVKGNSIVELMALILKAQAASIPAEEPAQTADKTNDAEDAGAPAGDASEPAQGEAVEAAANADADKQPETTAE